MEIAVLREHHPGEKRVALAPDHLSGLSDAGLSVRVEARAGEAAGWSDGDYREAGARVESDLATLLSGARVILKIRPPLTAASGIRDEIGHFPRDSLAISFLSPGADDDLPRLLAERGVSAIAVERIPRITRAQRMDALSSQATVAGYQAVLLAAAQLPRFFPMLTTAAGTIRPARVLVLGAGVAGLQAIATARRLGAVVEGYDIRSAAAEQVRSLGATFVEAELPGDAEAEGGYARALSGDETEKQAQLLSHHVPRADVVVTTAQIPGKPAPRLITRAMLEAMKPGSVVVDLAAETGGNCELTRPDEVVDVGGVTVLGPMDLPSGLAQHASQMYGTNVTHLLRHLYVEGDLVVDVEDEIVGAVLVVNGTEVRL